MDEFIQHCTELLQPIGSVRAKRMFGGHGLYVDEIFIAIVIAEQLYLKADSGTRARFEAAGCEPFRYGKKTGEAVSLSYFRAPEDAMESAALMQPWARLALEAALRARAGKSPPRARPAKKSAPGEPAVKPRSPRAR